MIAGELTHLAGEMDPTIGEQNLGLADATGIEDDLAGRGVARVVLIGDAEIEIAERHPHALSAPAHMDRLALERHRLPEGGTGLRRQLLLEAGLEGEVAGADDQLAHAALSRSWGRDINCRQSTSEASAGACPLQ